MFRELALVSACVAGSGFTFVKPLPNDASNHVRTANERISEVLRYVSQRSATFRNLVRAVDASPMVVYLEEGRCMEGRLRSCTQVMSAQTARYLRILVESRAPMLSVAAALAHELQHAVEIGSAPDVVDNASVDRLYQRIGFSNCPRGLPPCFETLKAMDVERSVLQEVERPNPTTSGVDRGFFGTWTLNVRRSLLDASDMPSSGCRILSDRSFGLISSVTTRVDFAGQSHHEAFVFRLDGSEYQMSVPADRSRRTMSVTPVDPFNAEFVIRENQDVVATGRWILSRDGRTLVVQTLRVDTDGNDLPTVEVWEKQRLAR